MCQSKAMGGLRCDTHAKDAVADSEIKYSKLVQKECLDKGITVAPASLVLTPDEEAIVKKKVRHHPTVLKANIERQRANWDMKTLQQSYADAIMAGDEAELYKSIARNDPALKELMDENAVNKEMFEATMHYSTLGDNPNRPDRKERDARIIANRKQAIVLMKERRTQILASCQQRAAEAVTAYYNDPSELESLVNAQAGVKAAKKKCDDAMGKLETAEKRASERAEGTVIANKLKKDPGFKAAESSADFRSSGKFKEWDTKNTDVQTQYKMTSGFQNKVAAKISSDKQAGLDTTKLEAGYKSLVVNKAKFAFRNIAQALGITSPEAKAAKAKIDSSREKVYTF